MRRVWTHEPLHVELGRDDEAVYIHQARRYGELVLPPVWTAA